MHTFLLTLLLFLSRGRAAAEFRCPEEFGYYPHPTDCSQYYVCVYGGPILESCAFGLVFSTDLQTCDWPRNVVCDHSGGDQPSGFLESAKETHRAARRQELPKEGGNANSNTSPNKIINSNSTPSQIINSNIDQKDINKNNSQGGNRNRKLNNQDSSKVKEDNSNSHNNIRTNISDNSNNHINSDNSDRNSNIRNNNRSSNSRNNVDNSNAVQKNLDNSKPTTDSSQPIGGRKKEKHPQADPTPSTTTSQATLLHSRLATRPASLAVEIVSTHPDTSNSPAVVPEDGAAVYGAKVSSSSGDSDDGGGGGPVPDLSRIEQELLASYPGVSTGLDDSQDSGGSDRFYYVNWEDPIYDHYEDFGDPSSEYDYQEEDRAQSDQESDANLLTIARNNLKASRQQFSSQENSRSDAGGAGVAISIGGNSSEGHTGGAGIATSSGRHGKSEPATKCDAKRCQLPECRCGSSAFPAGLSRNSTPQLIILTFDDAVNDLSKRLYQDIFTAARRNPNGCPIAATFFVSHEWTDYGQVQSLYADGHEIASHGISHSFGEQFSQTKWLNEMLGQKEILSAYGGVRAEDIRGMRAPFLAIGGNNMFAMLQEANFTYDSSMPIYDNKPPYYPYTLEHRLEHDCMIPPCPTRSFPGVWEIPLVMWNDLQGGRCSMADACSNPRTAQDVYLMILSNFQRHYNTNRAPFGLFYRPAWFTTPHHKEGFELFLDTVVAMEDVWLVTAWQTIQWMRSPTPVEKLNNFQPFQCNFQDRPNRCTAPKVCNLWHRSGVRYMRTCQSCPDFFPWTGRTGVPNSKVDFL